MILDRDIWAAALLLVRRYGEDAGARAAKRADELLAEGDTNGVATWRQIHSAIERLQAPAPAEDERTH